MSYQKKYWQYWHEKRAEAKEVIAEYLMGFFSDEKLAQLRTDAIAKAVPFMSCKRCLVGHSDEGWPTYLGDDYEWDMRRNQRAQHQRASSAYCSLGYSEKWEDSDSKRCSRLLKLVDAEITRRAALKAEAVAKAIETCAVTAEETVNV